VRHPDAGDTGVGEMIRPTVLVLKIYLRLREGWMSIHEMQDEFGVSRRTVYNYLRALDDAGIHLIREQESQWSEVRWTVI
jgi:DNA-binding transcriptional ArsR family regulator